MIVDMQTLAHPSSLSQSVTVVPQPKRIVALGDSLIYGYGDPEGGGWVERLRRQWMQPGTAGHILYNLGVRGDGVKQVSQRLEAEFRHRGELRNRVPDTIILSIGVNDSAKVGRSQVKNYTPINAFEAQISALLTQAQQLCPVIFVGMIPVNEAKMPFLDCLYYNHADQYRYKEATRQACADHRIPYLDLFDLWMSRGEAWCQARLCEDGLHPNVLGYRAILDDVLAWEAIAPLNS